MLLKTHKRTITCEIIGVGHWNFIQLKIILPNDKSMINCWSIIFITLEWKIFWCIPIMPPRILPRLSKANLWKATVHIKVTPKYLWKATTIYIATKFEYYLLMWRDLSQDPHLWSLWPSWTALMCFLKLVNDFP